MNNVYLASKFFTEPVCTESAYAGGALHTGLRAEPVYTGLHTKPVYTGAQQSRFRTPRGMFMNPMFIIILVCIILFLFIIHRFHFRPRQKNYKKN